MNSKNQKLDDILSMSEEHGQSDFSARFQKDCTTLLNIFPEEIWLLTVSYITEANFLENLNNSSLYFRKLLIPNQVNFLFPSVYPKLARLLECNKQFVDDKDNNYNSVPIWDAKRANPALHQVLTLRRVCRNWYYGVNMFYQSLPLQNAMREQLSHEEIHEILCPNEKPLDYIGEHILNTKEFSDSDPEDIEEFLNFFAKTHGSGERNPFLGRDVIVTCKFLRYRRDQQPEVLPDVTHVLKKYGQHIWYCKINIRDNYRNRRQCYSRLKSVLELMPNIRILYIRYSRKKKAINRVANEYLSTEENLEFEREIVVSGLRKFESLQYLKTRNLPVPVFNELVHTNAHVGKLHVDRDSELFENYNIYDLKMANLTKLHMKYYSEKDFRKLSIPSVNWHLTSLNLALSNFQFCDWKEMFLLLEKKWGHTLAVLIISLPTTVKENEENDIMRSCYHLKLQKLTRLELIINYLSSFDIIEPLQSTTRNNLITFSIEIRPDW